MFLFFHLTLLVCMCLCICVGENRVCFCGDATLCASVLCGHIIKVIAYVKA